MFVRAAMGSVALLLAACASDAPFQRPALPVPDRWDSTERQPFAQQAVHVHWRSFFADPRLQALIELALTNNRDMRIAVARVEEARAQYGIVRADRLPTIGALGAGSFSRTPADLSGVGGVVDGSRYDLSLTSVSFELDFWGRVAGLTDAAKSTYFASAEAQRAFQLSLVADLASSYFTLLQLDQVANLAKSTLDLRSQSLTLVDKGRELGGAYDFDVQLAQGMVASARATLDSVQYQRQVAVNRLNYLVGTTPTALPPGRPMDAQGLDVQLDAGLPGEVLLMRPDVMAAEQRLHAAHANIDAARAAFLPKVLLTAGVGVASQGLLGLFTGSAWTFQPSIAVPIFDGGRLSSALSVAEVRKNIAVAEYEKTIQLAFREVADLLAARESLVRQVVAAAASEGTQKRRLEITQARYQGGLSSFMEVLDSEREWVASQQLTAQVRRAQLESAAQLYKALGGGITAEESARARSNEQKVSANGVQK